MVAASEVNRVLERLADAEAAVMSLRRTLAEQHERTGRPYVMMIYGDHQPSMFVSNPKLDFAPHSGDTFTVLTAGAITGKFGNAAAGAAGLVTPSSSGSGSTTAVGAPTGRSARSSA